jgi:hypothetical protein
VIEVDSAFFWIQDSSIVELEFEATSINGHASWLLVNGSLKLSVALAGHVDIVGDAHQSDSCRVMAWALLCIVRVLVPSVDLVLLSVLESPDLKSSIAALGLGVAVKELLFGKLLQLSSFDEMLGLNGSDCREGPAGSA